MLGGAVPFTYPVLVFTVHSFLSLSRFLCVASLHMAVMPMLLYDLYADVHDFHAVMMLSHMDTGLDGNAVMFSGYNRNATVQNSDFAYIGGNAMAAWGYTNETATDPGRPGIALTGYPAAGVDGTDGEHPRYTNVISNTVREVGMYAPPYSPFKKKKK